MQDPCQTEGMPAAPKKEREADPKSASRAASHALDAPLLGLRHAGVRRESVVDDPLVAGRVDVDLRLLLQLLQQLCLVLALLDLGGQEQAVLDLIEALLGGRD